MNKQLSAKERGLIKGAIRRVFSRSELRRKVVDAAIIQGYSDSDRKRVKKWGLCAECKTPTPKSYLEVDHLAPVIPLDRTLESMTWDEVVDRIWCEESNLQTLCPTCHRQKSRDEMKQRRKAKNGR